MAYKYAYILETAGNCTVVPADGGGAEYSVPVADGHIVITEFNAALNRWEPIFFDSAYNDIWVRPTAFPEFPAAGQPTFDIAVGDANLGRNFTRCSLVRDFNAKYGGNYKTNRGYSRYPLRDIANLYHSNGTLIMTLDPAIHDIIMDSNTWLASDSRESVQVGGYYDKNNLSENYYSDCYLAYGFNVSPGSYKIDTY